VILAASLVDYPLRTPLVSSVFAIACAWLAMVPHNRAEEGGNVQTGEARTLASRKSRLGGPARIGIVLLGLAAALWISFGVTASSVLAPVAPGQVARWWPFDAGVQAALAASSLSSPQDPAAIQAAFIHAR